MIVTVIVIIVTVIVIIVIIISTVHIWWDCDRRKGVFTN
jgi:hypothetical protein